MYTLRRARYPRPDRSDFIPAAGEAGCGRADIGWDEGLLSDGRPFRAEAWVEGRATVLTIFFCARGLREASSEALGRLLAGEGLLRFAGDRRRITTRRWVDPAGNALWAVDVIVADQDARYVAVAALTLKPYRA